MANFITPVNSSAYQRIADHGTQVSIQFDNASLIVSKDELVRIVLDAQQILSADVAHPLPDFPGDVPASLDSGGYPASLAEQLEVDE